MAKKTGAVKKKVVKVDAQGMAHVHSTFNNVIITLTNAAGEVISWSSAGKMGFRGSKKNTPYAAQTAATDCAKVAYDMGLRKVNQPFAPSMELVSKCSRSSMLLRCLITDAVPPTVAACN